MAIEYTRRFRITECCDSNNTLIVSYSNETTLPGYNVFPLLSLFNIATYQYTGPDIIVGAAPYGTLAMYQDSCYIIEQLEVGTAVTHGPGDYDDTSSVWTFLGVNQCDAGICPDCDPGLTYLKFTGCCEGEVLRFKGAGAGGPEEIFGSVDYSQYEGLINFIGTPIDGLTNQCYTVEHFNVGDVEPPGPGVDVPTVIEWSVLPSPPIMTGNFIFLRKEADCVEDIDADGVRDCPECPEVCYRVWNCDGEFFDTTNDLSADVFTGSNFVILAESGVDLPGSWMILLNEGSCNNAIHTISVTGAAPDCECTCYEVTGSGAEINYIDCDGVFTKEYVPAKFCSLITPLVKGDPLQYQLTTGDACVDGECPEQCFILTNCDPTAWPLQDAVLNSTLQSLSQYVNTSEVVVLSGYDGCWTVTEAVECDCPVDVTVIRDHEDCEDCLGITAYKLTNCEKINEVVYSIQDLSAFVGQVIKDECNCWTVEEIDYQPPSETTIVDPILYTDCSSCLSTYYQLDNCDTTATSLQIITSTNLSTYVGQVIKIEKCEDCFTVSEYIGEVEPASWEDVIVTEGFVDCPTCQVLTSRCSTVFNNSITDRTYTYVDANGDLQETEIVRSGHFSLRHCVQRWTLTEDCTCLAITVDGEASEALVTNTYPGTNPDPTRSVFTFVYSGTTYYIWFDITVGFEGWYISPTVGSFISVIAYNYNTAECPIYNSTSNPLAPDSEGWVGNPEHRVVITVSCVIPIYNYYGDCTVYDDGTGNLTGFCVQYFPNSRKVKPGYNTPICSADKYDKITCKAAEIMYKKVLELRYGISNCCPEEDEKWLISKELIELQALTDPNYTCDPLTDCCGQPVSSCSCNS